MRLELLLGLVGLVILCLGKYRIDRMQRHCHLLLEMSLLFVLWCCIYLLGREILLGHQSKCLQNVYEQSRFQDKCMGDVGCFHLDTFDNLGLFDGVVLHILFVLLAVLLLIVKEG